MTHIKCAGVLTDNSYDKLCSNGDDFMFICNQCSIHALPFPDGSTYDAISDQQPIFHSFVDEDGRYPDNDSRQSDTTIDHTDQSSSDRPLDF